MAQIKDLTINIGPIEQVVLYTGIRIFSQPEPPAVPCRKVTLAFNMAFSEGEIGLQYRLAATLFANDRPEDDEDDGIATPFYSFLENEGLTELSNLTAEDRGFTIFPRTYQSIRATAISIPKQIFKYIRTETLNEDPKIDFSGFPRPRINFHKDELLARVVLSQVAEVKSEPAHLR